MQFDNIEAVRKYSWAGNAHSDHDAMTAIDAFVANDTHSIADRAEALRIMGRDGMGLEGEDNGDDLTDEELVAEWRSCQ